MEIKLSNKEIFNLPITDRTKSIAVNKVSFTKGFIKDDKTSIILTAEVAYPNKTPDTHTLDYYIHSDPLPFKINMYEYMKDEGYSFMQLKTAHVEVRNERDCEVIIDVDLLD